MDGPPGAFISAVCRSQRAWFAGLTLRDGVSTGLAQNPTPMAQSLPQQRFVVSKDSWAMGAKQSFVLRAGQCHCSPWHVGVSTPSIFSALCPGKQDLARAQPAVAEV